MNHLTIRDHVTVRHHRHGNRPVLDATPLRGLFYAQLIRQGRTIADLVIQNGVTDAAKTQLLNVYFNGATAPATFGWSIGLINASGFSAISNLDTMGSHAGWTEFVNYTNSGGGSGRAPWSPATPANKVITSAGTPVTFTFTSSGSVQGIFLTSDSTKNGNIGTLWSTAIFPGSALQVSLNDTLQIGYGVSL